MKKTKTLSSLFVLVFMMSLFAGCSNTANLPAVSSVPEVTPSVDAPTESGNVDGYEEGTSDSDQIVNTTMADKVILVVSFGTSFNQSRDLTIGGIEAAVKNAYPDYQVRRAFTSQIIIDKLAQREGLRIDNVTQAMDRLVLDGVKEVIIQPTTVMNGFEYDDVIKEIMPYTDKFESMKIGKWLLADDSDYEEVAEILVNETSQFRADDTAIVFMGHGTEHDANSAYTKLQEVLKNKGYPDYLIGTVEAEPSLEDIQEQLKEMDIKKVILRPLMVVAGDHANNDMAGDEADSWKTMLSADGYTVETILDGLGQVKGVQDIFIQHIENAEEVSNQRAAEPATTAIGISAGRIQNGTYSIDVDSDTAMFKIVDCQLTVEDRAMTAVMTLSGQGFGSLFMGIGEEALNAAEDSLYHYTDNGERHTFTVPVEALDRELDCAGFSIRKEQWYDHVVVFKSANIPNDAFLPCKVNVEMSGGSGRASVESPAELTYADGQNMAKIVWSSPNYTDMLVDDVKYIPINTEGNSVFEIPVALDKDMTVMACTVAMGEPKEVEYVLHFDSASIQ